MTLLGNSRSYMRTQVPVGSSSLIRPTALLRTMGYKFYTGDSWSEMRSRYLMSQFINDLRWTSGAHKLSVRGHNPPPVAQRSAKLLVHHVATLNDWPLPLRDSLRYMQSRCTSVLFKAKEPCIKCQCRRKIRLGISTRLQAPTCPNVRSPSRANFYTRRRTIIVIPIWSINLRKPAAAC